jgi:plasmid replication initiation protein
MALKKQTREKAVNNDEFLEHLFHAREVVITKSENLIQNSRYDLSVNEQRIILYAISQINPADSELTEYTLKLKDLFDICGIGNESYAEIKEVIKKLSDKSWWLTSYDKTTFKKTETLIRWFSTLCISKDASEIKVKFHEDMFSLLLNLYDQYSSLGFRYSKYPFIYVLPMKCKYSIRLFELLKSYANNNEWWFMLNELRTRLDCLNKYETYKDFKKWVLQPSIREINDFTDLEVSYKATKNGNKINKLFFAIRLKPLLEIHKAKIRGNRVLNGCL